MRSSKSLFVGGGLAEKEFVFFLNFLCKFEPHDCFNFSCKVSWRMIRFADTALSFSMIKSLLHLALVSVCNYNLLVMHILDMWFCNLFNVSVRQHVGYSRTIPLRPFVVNLPSDPNPSCVVCSWFLCDWWLLSALCHVA